MSAAFHLRPVAAPSPSPTPSADGPAPRDRSPPYPKGPPASARPRRPLSPSSLRELDLRPDADAPPRKYPAPPTGHDLMALFPPAPPGPSLLTQPGPTSGFFQRQERAFFAQAGREIVRVRVEVDVPRDAEHDAHAKARTQPPPPPLPQSAAAPATAPAAAPPARGWPPHPHPHPSPAPAAAAPLPPLYPAARSAARPAASASAAAPAPFPLAPAAPTLRTPVPDAGAPELGGEEFRDDPDESWRRPMPYAERRRAGKHTKRVIVRN